MPSITFPNQQGITLSGYIHKPVTGSVIAFAVFAHCFTCTKNSKAAKHIADALVAKGIGVLRFDFTGLGGSDGEFGDTHFSSNVSDIVAAANYLAEHYKAPEILIGHSLGGTAILAAAKHIASAKAVATIGSPADAEHILHLFGKQLVQIKDEGEMEVSIGGRPFTIKNTFIEDVSKQAVKEDLHSLRKALLVMHSPLDQIVSIDQASEIFTHAKHPKSFVTLDNADHLLSQSADSHYAANVLAAWASRYLETPSPVEKEFPAYKKGVTTVRAHNADDFLCTINSDGHLMLADEPLSHGGSHLGMSPFDLLSAALGACTAMTLNMYARHKQLSVETIEVVIKHQKIPTHKCDDCETKEGKIDEFERSIIITGDITEAQRQRMIQISDRCPVHRTLHSEIKVRNT